MFFFFNDTATTEIYTLSLHDALPISLRLWPPDRARLLQKRATRGARAGPRPSPTTRGREPRAPGTRRGCPWVPPDRKSTRLNSSHANISYAVFCLKKKKTQYNIALAT